MVRLVEQIINVRNEVTRSFLVGDFEAGDNLLAEKSSLLPDHIKLECLGNRYFYSGGLQDAVRCYEEAISLVPDHPISRYQYLVGTQEEKSENFVDAFKRYQMAIEVDPEFIDSYIELGGLMVKVEDFAGAVRCYRDAFKLDGSDEKNFYNLKTVLEKLVRDGADEYQEELSEVIELGVPSVAPLANHEW